jgi:hypothetical protein
MTAEKMRRKSFVTFVGNCKKCGQPVKSGQEYILSDNSIQHALCLYDPAYVKRVLRSKTEH